MTVTDREYDFLFVYARNSVSGDSVLCRRRGRVLFGAYL